jgi:hypothetical protein
VSRGFSSDPGLGGPRGSGSVARPGGGLGLGGTPGVSGGQ